MDSARFDDLSRFLGTRHHRRALGGLLGGTLLGLLHLSTGAKRRTSRRTKTAAKTCRDVGHPCEGNQTCCEGLRCTVTGPGAAKRCAAASPGQCLALGAPCDWRQPRACCSGSCRTPGTTTQVPHPPRPGETFVCVDQRYGCTAEMHSCPAQGPIQQNHCPALGLGTCLVSVDGLPFCGGASSTCMPCQHDEDCNAFFGAPGNHCVECAGRCSAPQSGTRACFSEGLAAE